MPVDIYFFMKMHKWQVSSSQQIFSAKIKSILSKHYRHILNAQ